MKTLWATCLLFGLAGCATDGYETVTLPMPEKMGNRMATDAIKQLQALYPPGQTQFNIGQPVPQTDVFGTALVKALRETGYAVQEYSPDRSTRASGGLNVRYSVDKPETNLMAGLYRLKLSVGNSVLTRAYTVNNQLATPAGAWAVME